MPETLLTPSSIKMFGRVVTSLSYQDDTSGSVIGNNNFLEAQFAVARTTAPINIAGDIAQGDYLIKNANPVASLGNLKPGMTLTAAGIPSFAVIDAVYTAGFTPRAGGAAIAPNTIKMSMTATATTPNIPIVVSLSVGFARIYAFSFEGAIYSLPRPAMFFVHGGGVPIDVVGSGGRTSTDNSGVVAREWEFSAAGVYGNVTDLRYWEYEKGDFSMRLDVEAGQLEQILLVAALRAGADMADRTGVRSGASLAGASLAGASLAGASLSGASLSGASLSGASLSGASLRNGR